MLMQSVRAIPRRPRYSRTQFSNAAFWLSRYMASLLFEIQPHDATTLVAVSVMLFLVALLATHAPARSASRVDPIVALRQG